MSFVHQYMHVFDHNKRYFLLRGAILLIKKCNAGKLGPSGYADDMNPDDRTAAIKALRDGVIAFLEAKEKEVASLSRVEVLSTEPLPAGAVPQHVDDGAAGSTDLTRLQLELVHPEQLALAKVRGFEIERKLRRERERDEEEELERAARMRAKRIATARDDAEAEDAITEAVLAGQKKRADRERLVALRNAEAKKEVEAIALDADPVRQREAEAAKAAEAAAAKKLRDAEIDDIIVTERTRFLEAPNDVLRNIVRASARIKLEEAFAARYPDAIKRGRKISAILRLPRAAAPPKMPLPNEFTISKVTAALLSEPSRIKYAAVYRLSRSDKDKWYVGSAVDLLKRLWEHAHSEAGATWVKLHGLGLFFHPRTPRGGSLEEWEDRETHNDMVEYGVRNVRGGSYSAPEMSLATAAEAARRCAQVKKLCKRCGRDGHSYAECSFDTYAAFAGGGAITGDLVPR